MDATSLKLRTKRFALDIIAFTGTLKNNQVCQVLGRQLLRSGTSVSANYRAACRAKSKPDFAFKIAICEEEADESAHWIELLVESGQVRYEKCSTLLNEANELTAIMYTSKMTVRRGLAGQSTKTFHTPNSTIHNDRPFNG